MVGLLHCQPRLPALASLACSGTLAQRNAAALPSSRLLPCATLRCNAGSSKRDYVRWAPEEEAAFFEALRGVAGQKPEKCLKEIVARVGTKDYAQVGGWGIAQWWQELTADQPSAGLTPAAAGLVSGAQVARALHELLAPTGPSTSCSAAAGAPLLLPPHQAAEQDSGRGAAAGHQESAAGAPSHGQVLGRGEWLPHVVLMGWGLL